MAGARFFICNAYGLLIHYCFHNKGSINMD